MPSAKASRPTPTFIQTARRAQLIECAIEVIAEVGVEKASLVAIAERAGISRGVISYHFDSRAALLDSIVAEVYQLGATAMADRVADAPSPRAALAAFITGSVQFYAAYPRQMAALSAIFASGHVPEALARDSRVEHAAEMLEVDTILADGQARSDFREFDTRVMTMTIRAALDAALQRIRAGDDPKQLGSELATTFDIATRAGGPS
ncbi:TetR family transcriptional regulator [Williamsia sp. 1138]|uniref:TetR/AcrR family transcriptional regulator n=1 Tax=Williamsia sp. 1138 TaxID=1903117 RepID=UPI000A11968F|nr:TetR family transcriptional regulator [Williamsia sp. 1138]OZG26429.1 TetR family transcriptional regulator [Williamsia sp. 1138]